MQNFSLKSSHHIAYQKKRMKNSKLKNVGGWSLAIIKKAWKQNSPFMTRQRLKKWKLKKFKKSEIAHGKEKGKAKHANDFSLSTPSIADHSKIGNSNVPSSSSCKLRIIIGYYRKKAKVRCNSRHYSPQLFDYWFLFSFHDLFKLQWKLKCKWYEKILKIIFIRHYRKSSSNTMW